MGDMIKDTPDRPKEAGQVETVTKQLPAKIRWVAIMLRSIDKNNNAGEFSNMVTTYFVLCFHRKVCVHTVRTTHLLT